MGTEISSGRSEASSVLFANTSSHSPCTSHGKNGGSPTKRQKTDHTATIIDIDKDEPGDTVIKFGGDESVTLLRVHRLALKLSSPMFKAIFSPDYKEGSKTYNQSGPLALPDDDPISFHDLCKILHHQINDHTSLHLSQFPDLAVIANKYLCTAAIRPWRSALLGPHFESKLATEEVALRSQDLHVNDAMCLAYIFGDA